MSEKFHLALFMFTQAYYTWMTPMFSHALRAEDSAQFKCGFCGFVYQEIVRAEECELRCVTRALDSMEKRETVR